MMATPIRPMTAAEENRLYLRAFIQTYRNLPVLWDTSLRDYTNRDKRARAYEQLVPLYRYLKREANVDDVKKKINTLRTNYRKELKVVECARRSGTPHQPRCWTFHELDFLRHTEKFLAVTPNSRSHSFGYNENSQTQAAFLEHNSYNMRTLTTENGNIQPFGPEQKVEPQNTPPLSSTPSINADVNYQHNAVAFNEGGPATVKRQRLSPVHNSDDLLNIACDYISSNYPEEESIARTWTQKLKRMPREQRLLAEKFINEILFEGESGTLHRESLNITPLQKRPQTQLPSKVENIVRPTPVAPTLSAVEVPPPTVETPDQSRIINATNNIPPTNRPNYPSYN